MMMAARQLHDEARKWSSKVSIEAFLVEKGCLLRKDEELSTHSREKNLYGVNLSLCFGSCVASSTFLFLPVI
jgi:hypothetical protein